MEEFDAMFVMRESKKPHVVSLIAACLPTLDKPAFVVMIAREQPIEVEEGAQITFSIDDGRSQDLAFKWLSGGDDVMVIAEPTRILNGMLQSDNLNAAIGSMKVSWDVTGFSDAIEPLETACFRLGGRITPTP